MKSTKIMVNLATKFNVSVSSTVYDLNVIMEILKENEVCHEK